MEILPEIMDDNRFERSAEIADLVDKLPEELREVIILRYYQEMKYREIANILGIGLIGGMLAMGALCGFSEAGLPIQLWNTSIPYRMTMGQLCIMEVAVILLITAAFTAMILLISAQTKSTLAAMAAILVLFIGSAFMGNSDTLGWYNHLLGLCAVRFIDLKNVLGSFADYRLGSVIVDYVTMGIFVYAVVTLVSLLPLKKIFVKRIMQG